MDRQHDLRTTEPGEATLDRRGLRVLDLTTCLARLAACPVGRIAMFDRGGVVILPVNHVVDGMTIGFRTTTGTKLFHAIHGSEVGFEVDDFDASTRTGWSVLAQGTAALAGDAEAARLDRLASTPWISRTDRWVVIHAHEISGRELVAGDSASRDAVDGGLPR